MKNLKKIVSVIVTVAMLISSLAAVTVSAGYADVDASNSYNKAITVLSGLGVVKGDDEGNFNPTNDIKRSEMVALICRAMGEEAVAQSAGGSTFDDVVADHWAAGYIAWGVAGNIINGVGDNKFDPDASVKFQDAVVMILRALGYERIAQRPENGGYPTGYLKVASQRGVLANAKFDGGKAATREVVAQVIYNALTTPLVDVSYYAPDPADDEYVVYDGKNKNDLRTLLTYKNEIYKVKATVDATAKTDPATYLKDPNAPKVKLTLKGAYDYAKTTADDKGIYDILGVDAYDAIVIYAGATDVADYFGSTVEAYIAEDENDDWVLVAVAADSKSTVSETVSENFESFGANGSDFVFKYWEDENDSKAKEIDVLSGYTVYYNGQYMSASDITTNFTSIENLLVNVANSITFTGDRTAAGYNKIFVTDYRYAQVDEVNADDLFVKCDGLSFTLDAEERGNESFVYNLYDAEGNTIDLADVKEDDLLNIVAPYGDLDDVAFMDIYVTNTVVEGRVDEELIADAKYKIAGEIYELDANAVGDVDTGDEGVFFITIDGLVFAADAASVVNKNYSFVVAVGEDASFGVNTYEIKLFTAEGELETYTVASTLKVFNGDSDSLKKRNDGTQDAYFTTLKATIANQADIDDAKDNLKKRICTFATNANGEIRELRFAVDGDKFDVDPLTGATVNTDTEVFARKDYNEASKLFVAPVTKVFDATTTDDTTDVDLYNVDEEDLAMASFATLNEKEAGGYNGYLFSFTNEDFIGAVVLNAKIAGSMDNAHLAVVKSKATGIDDQGADVVKYTIVESGETKELYVDNDATVATLTVGDIFRYTVNAAGEINDAHLILDDVTTFSDTHDSSDYTYAAYVAGTEDTAIVYGTIIDITGNKMTLQSAFDLNEDSEVDDKDQITLRMNDTEGNTYAQIDVAKLSGSNPSTAVKALSGAGYIKESYGRNNYDAVVIIGESDRFEDIVQIYSEIPLV